MIESAPTANERIPGEDSQAGRGGTEAAGKPGQVRGAVLRVSGDDREQ